MPKQDVAFELFYDGAWHDLVVDDDVLGRAPVVVRRGQGDESPAPRPAQITATLANDDDRYRTSNPESPLYGKAGRNTPTRVAVGGVTRGRVEASSWVCGQTRDFRAYPRRGSAWTEFDGGGLLQRINQWTQPLKSPFRQFNEALDADHVIGYFPGEQERGSTELFSTVPGTTTVGIGGGFSGMAFDSQYRPPGSAPLMDVGDDAAVGVFFAGTSSATATDGWQLSWGGRYEPLIPGEQTIMYWLTGDGTAYGLFLDATTGEMLIYSSLGGVAVLANGSSYGSYDWSQWTLFSIDAQYSAGTTTVWVNWTNADNTVSDFMNASFAGVPASLDWVSWLGGDGEIPPGSTIGHILGANVDSGGGVNLFHPNRISAWTGYLHERAAVRFGRLCDQLGIPYYASDGWDTSAKMGPQPVDTLPNHFKEIATTEDALIYDHRTDPRLYILCRGARYTQTPACELVPEDLPSLPREVTDDLPVHNLVTVSQRDGGEYTVEDATGPLGTQAPPDGVGEYRQTVDVNVSAAVRRLPNLANWWLRRGTVNLPRFPQVTVNMAVLSPSKLAEVEDVEVGSVLTITGYREDVIRLHVLGYTEPIGQTSRTITFVCAPDQQFDVARYDDDSKRKESRTSTLVADYGPADTSLVVTFTSIRDAWSTTNEPYDWAVAGERITVTSMGAVTGSGPWTQTATVRRSVNGVRKRLRATDPVHMHPAQQARYAL
jgi:hypothetical protein